MGDEEGTGGTLSPSQLLLRAQVVSLTWQGEGLRGFYKGIFPALVRTMPHSALTLVVYEQTLQWLRAQ